jgi:hypothetical protein
MNISAFFLAAGDNQIYSQALMMFLLELYQKFYKGYA